MAYRDICFPQGEKRIQGKRPDSFKEHDLHPVDEGHVSKLGISFDWLQVCSRCGYEDYGIGPTNHQERTWREREEKRIYTDEEREALKSERSAKLEQVDAHVQTLPYRTGNTTMARDSGDFIANSCPNSTDRKGWHSTRGKSPQVINYYTTRLEGRTHYKNTGFVMMLRAMMSFGNLQHSSDGKGSVTVYECEFCGKPVKRFAGFSSSTDSGT
tara:strand:+ start:692 stop:1330 length:639 start_codon:yes stop_codon:yes gene_type:complete